MNVGHAHRIQYKSIEVRISSLHLESLSMCRVEIEWEKQQLESEKNYYSEIVDNSPSGCFIFNALS